MSRAELKCDNCGAPLMKGKESCVFCGSQFREVIQDHPVRKAPAERELHESTDTQPAQPPVYNAINLITLLLGLALSIFLLKVWHNQPFSTWDSEMKVSWSFFELLFVVPLLYFGMPHRLRSFFSVLAMLFALGVGIMATRLGLFFIYIPCYGMGLFLALFLIGRASSKTKAKSTDPA